MHIHDQRIMQDDSSHGNVFNKRIRDRICDLAKSLAEAEDAQDFKEKITGFYKEFGVGKLGLHKAFRIEHTDESAQIVPITKYCTCTSG